MNQRYRGIILVLIATLLFSVLDTSSKFLTAHYAAAQIVWMRYLCQFILVLLIVAPGRWREITMTRRPLLTILRGAMQGCSSLFVVMAFSTLPLAETTSMVFISPLLVALFAGPILGEKVSRGQWLLIVAGFSGVLLIARPGGAVFGVGMLYALACSVCYALYQVLTRKLTATEPPIRLLFYNGLLGTLNMAEMAVRVAQLEGSDAAMVQAAAGILLVVFCGKAALLPMYLWLPPTYTYAPAAVAALFAIMTKVGLYAVLRTGHLSFGAGDPLDGFAWPALLLLGAVTLALASLGALAERRLRTRRAGIMDVFPCR